MLRLDVDMPPPLVHQCRVFEKCQGKIRFRASHPFVCKILGGHIVMRHNNIVDFLFKDVVVKEAPHSEKEPREKREDIEDARRPDIAFKHTDPVTDDTVPVLLDNHAFLDVAIIAPPLNLLMSNSRPSIHDNAYWSRMTKQKSKKHSYNVGKCLPFVIAITGAVEPSALKWLAEVQKDKVWSRPMSFYVRTIAISIWKCHGNMTTKYDALEHSAHAIGACATDDDADDDDDDDGVDDDDTDDPNDAGVGGVDIANC